MKITVEFNSVDEISEFQKIYVAGNNIIEDFVDEAVRKHLKAAEAPNTENPKPKKEKPAPAEDKKADEDLPFTEKKEEEPAPVEEKAEEPKKKDLTEFKVEVRKLLTKVNKTTGKNQAKEWIKNLGHDSLEDVVDEDELTTLKQLAEETLNA